MTSSDEVEVRRSNTYEVNTCNLVGLSSFDGRGRNGVRLSSIFWKRLGMPGNMQSLPAKRTTGYYHRFSILFVSPRKNRINRFFLKGRGESKRKITHDPYILSYEQHLYSISIHSTIPTGMRKPRHLLPRQFLFWRLLLRPPPMPTSLFHPLQSFLVVLQLAKGKCTCKGAVCDICVCAIPRFTSGCVVSL